MTWSGTAGSDSKFSLEPFAGAGDKKVLSADRPVDAATHTTTIEKSSGGSPSQKVSLTAPIDIPMQSNVEPSLQPDVALAIPLPPVKKPVVERSHREICDTLADAAQSNDLPVPFFIRLLFQESRFQAGVVSHAGAEGIAQFMPQTAAGMGLQNSFDPLQAIPASARLLRDLMQQFGNLGLAAAAYNAGPKRIQDWLSRKGKLPEETQGYVKTITGKPAETWMVARASHADMRLPRRAPCQDRVGLHAWNGPDRIPLPPSRTPATPVLVAQHQKPTTRDTNDKSKAPVRLAELKIANKESDKSAAKEIANATAKNAPKVVAKVEAKTKAKSAQPVAKANNDNAPLQLAAARTRKDAR